MEDNNISDPNENLFENGQPPYESQEENKVSKMSISKGMNQPGNSSLDESYKQGTFDD